MAAETSMNATYVENDGINYRLPMGAEVIYGTGNVFAGYKTMEGRVVSAATLTAATTTAMHSYYDNVATVAPVAAVATVGPVATPTVGVIATPTVGKMYANHTVGVIATPTVGAISTPTVGAISTPTFGVVGMGGMGQMYYDKKAGKMVGVVGVNAGVAAAKVGMMAGKGAMYTSEDETYVMLSGHKFMIPTGAHIMYDSEHNFAGYMMTGGQMITVDTMMRTSTDDIHSYYDKTVGAIATPTGMVKTTVAINTSCTPVSPVANGIPQYSHDGCLTGYVVKNSATPIGCTSVSPVANGFPQYNHAGCIEGYVVKNSAGMITFYEDISVATMKAASTGMHSYYAKTVGATVGAIATPTVGKIATPTVGVIATPTIGVVGVNTGVNAGMMAKKVSEADSYVLYQGHHFMVPAGASEEYNVENVFMGYKLPNGEMVTVDEMMTAANQTVHSYYDVAPVAQVAPVATVGVVATPTTGAIATPTTGIIATPTTGIIATPTTGIITTPTIGKIAKVGKIATPTVGK
jgi:hypothetical protein